MCCASHWFLLLLAAVRVLSSKGGIADTHLTPHSLRPLRKGLEAGGSPCAPLGCQRTDLGAPPRPPGGFGAQLLWGLRQVACSVGELREVKKNCTSSHLFFILLGLFIWFAY